jgi:hypothetical protein
MADATAPVAMASKKEKNKSDGDSKGKPGKVLYSNTRGWGAVGSGAG